MNIINAPRYVAKLFFVIVLLCLLLSNFGSSPATVVEADSLSALTDQSETPCTIIPTNVPPFGATPPFKKNEDLRLYGKVVCVDGRDLTRFWIVVYIYTSPDINAESKGWWIKPRWDDPTTKRNESLTPILDNGKWNTKVYTCCVDHLATKYAIFLIPKNYYPPQSWVGSDIPQELFDNSDAYLIVDRAPISPPTLVLPIDAEPQITRRPHFKWDDVTDASGYNIQIANDVNFKQVILNVKTVDSSYTPTNDLPINHILYWRVRTLIDDVYRNWSEVQSFTTGNPPNVPVLRSPANNALVKSYFPKLRWYKSSVPTGTTFKHYQIQVDDNSDFSSPEIDEITLPGDINAVMFTPDSDLAPDTKYYWHVRAFNDVSGAEHASSWSTPRNFKTSPTVFDNGVWYIKKDVSSPDDFMSVYVDGVFWGKTHLLQIGHLKSGSDYPEVAAIYDNGYLRLVPLKPLGITYGTSFILGPAHWDSNDNYFHNLKISRIDIDTSKANPSGSLKITITARDYNSSIWPSYHFDITYQIIFPDPKGFKTSMSISQTYTAASDFDLSIARQANHEGFKIAQFSSMYIDDIYHDSDSVYYINLNEDEHLVPVKDKPCDYLINDTPLGLSMNNPWVQLLHSDDDGWQGNTPNTIIRLDDPGFAGQIVPQGYLTCSTNPNNDNVGLWLNDESAPVSFSTGQSFNHSYTLISQDDPMPAAPGLITPGNGQIVSTRRPAFDWNDRYGVTSYTIQISTSPSFGTKIISKKVYTSDYIATVNLPENKAIFWRVRANGPNGPSAWSMFQFTIILP